MNRRERQRPRDLENRVLRLYTLWLLGITSHFQCTGELSGRGPVGGLGRGAAYWGSDDANFEGEEVNFEWLRVAILQGAVCGSGRRLELTPEEPRLIHLHSCVCNPSPHGEADRKG